MELKRRNVLRAAVLYAGAVWAFGQGLSQFSPALGFPDWITRWFLVAAIIGFPFWLALAWFYEFTPHGLKRESEIAPDDSVAHSTARKLDFWIIGMMALAIVLLLTNTVVWHKGAGLQATSPRTDAAAEAQIPEKSIAVLPLANESGDKNQQYFSDDLSEDLITALSQFAGLKVIGRNSSFQFRNTDDDAKTIGEKLGVAHLLEGSVRRAGDVVRISAELINAVDGSTLWSQHYDRPYKDVFALQDDITHAVATELKATLLSGGGSAVQSDRPPSGNLDAYNDYLRGVYLGDRHDDEDLRKSIDYFNAAIRIDLNYARAYAMISGAWTTLAQDYYAGKQLQEAYAKAQAAADTAMMLDPNLAVAHLARGYLLYSHDFDWSGALVEYRRALQLAPNESAAKALLANVLATLGQTEHAIELTRDSLLTSPMSGTSYFNLSSYYLGLGRFDDAERATRTQMTLEPNQVNTLHGPLAAIEILRGNADAALRDAQRVPHGPYNAIYSTMALQIGVDRAAADAALKDLIDKYAAGGPFQIAEVYALRKDPDKMFEWLDRAWDSRDPGISSLLYDAFVLRYQHDPRFATLCKKAGLPLPIQSLPAATESDMPPAAASATGH